MGSIRSARVCYQEALTYAHKRKTFGKYLFEHGVIRNKLGHMVRQIEVSILRKLMRIGVSELVGEYSVPAWLSHASRAKY